MHSSKKTEKHEKNHNNEHEHFLLFLCFLTSALIGYFLTHHVVLLGA